MNKGYILTIDALMALTMVVLVIILVMEVQTSVRELDSAAFKKIHYISEDTLQILNKKGVLDQICTEWALSGNNENSSHWMNARYMAERYLPHIIPENVGYSLVIDDKELCNDSRVVRREEASVLTHSTRILSGYNPYLPTEAYVARANLNETNVSYAAPLKDDEGCNWTLEFSDFTIDKIKIPSDYEGIKDCEYSSSSIVYDNESAIDDAVYRLLLKLDNPPQNGRIDKKFTEDDVIVDVSVVGGVRSMWGPVEVKLVMWMK
ncbi:MAG: hypothetical protein JW724_00815 [Candidatus Altiarchaeota archaeon]|nr:hypothetical protein [Candidatus Altiarchaeota archaeon]